jgi:hypothetical protein
MKYAHFINQTVAGFKLVMVVITDDLELQADKLYTGTLCENTTEANNVAAKLGATVIQPVTRTLQ